MSCERWKPVLVAHLYDEIDAAERAALTEHLAGCADCRREMEELAVARERIREVELDVPSAPRLLVLSSRPRARLVLAFAAGVACALLLGAAAGVAGYRLAGGGASAATGVASEPVTASGDDAIRREVDRRWSALEAELKARADGTRPASPASQAVPARTRDVAITREQLETALSRFERRMNASRSSDIDYVLNQIAASEERTGFRIGETRQALRYVALANNPALSEK